MKEYLQRAANVARRKLQEAEDKVRDSKSALIRARGKMQSWKSDLDDYKRYLQRKSDELEQSKRNAKSDCKRECKKGDLC